MFRARADCGGRLFTTKLAVVIFTIAPPASASVTNRRELEFSNQIFRTKQDGMDRRAERQEMHARRRDEDVVGDTLNLWQGFAVKDRKPDGKSGAAGCKLFLDHGLKIICSGDEEHYDFLIKREALIAQRRIRSEIAVCLHTEAEGTGKGRWCRSLNHLYGDHAMQVQNPDHVIGKHNAHLERLLRLTADEALFALDPRHRNALRPRLG